MCPARGTLAAFPRITGTHNLDLLSVHCPPMPPQNTQSEARYTSPLRRMGPGPPRLRPESIYAGIYPLQAGTILDCHSPATITTLPPAVAAGPPDIASVMLITPTSKGWGALPVCPVPHVIGAHKHESNTASLRHNTTAMQKCHFADPNCKQVHNQTPSGLIFLCPHVTRWGTLHPYMRLLQM
jgi:hypothetical protein